MRHDQIQTVKNNYFTYGTAGVSLVGGRPRKPRRDISLTDGYARIFGGPRAASIADHDDELE